MDYDDDNFELLATDWAILVSDNLSFSNRAAQFGHQGLREIANILIL